MIEDGMTLRTTEGELARDFHTVLERVREEGLEVIVERDHCAVAVIRAPQEPGRKLSDCIDLARAYEERFSNVPARDADFAADVRAAVDAHRESLDPTGWG